MTYARKVLGLVGQPAETRDGVHDVLLASGLASQTVRSDSAATADIASSLFKRASDAMAEAKKVTRNKSASELIAAKLH